MLFNSYEFLFLFLPVVLALYHLGPRGAQTGLLAASILGVTHPDIREALRAYRTAFLYWLREEAEGKQDESRAAFAQFLRALAEGGGEVDLPTALSSAYGRPLSAADPADPSLEADFLRWLSRKR